MTEIRRLATRAEVSQSEATDLAARIDLLGPDRAMFTEAGLLPGANLRSLDALHIAVAIRAQAESMITYDRRQTTAARQAGLPVFPAGASTSTDPPGATG